MVGQGWGIDEARGGLRIYDALRRAEPDVFVHSGDNIYADQPLLAEVKLDDGTIWKNVVTEAKSKVAETLDEFRGCFAYNMLDPHAQKFGSSVPLITQWDDHEVVDNWFHDLVLQNDTRFTESACACWPSGPSRRCSSSCPSGAMPWSGIASIARSRMGHWSRSSWWTCAAIAAPTRATNRRSSMRRPPFWP